MQSNFTPSMAAGQAPNGRLISRDRCREFLDSLNDPVRRREIAEALTPPESRATIGAAFRKKRDPNALASAGSRRPSGSSGSLERLAMTVLPARPVVNGDTSSVRASVASKGGD